MSEKSEYYVEQLLGAISTIARAENAVNNHYDKTEIGTIVEDSGKNIGEYWVIGSGKSKYQVYCDPEVARYKIGDVVRISIPNNDYRYKKYIIGKEIVNTNYSSDNISPLDSVILPEGEYIQLGTNFYIGAAGQKHYLPSPLKVEEKYNVRDIYNTLCIKMLIRSFINSEVLHSNIDTEYQLIFRVIDEYKQQHDLIFSSKNMFGNPYNFKFATPQQVKFAIDPLWGDIKSIELYAYASPELSSIYPAQPDLGLPENMENQILVVIQNLEINFGGELSQVENQEFKLYIVPSENDLYETEPAVYNKQNTRRKINIQWFNKDTNEQYIGFTDGKIKSVEELIENDNSTQYHDTNILKHYDEFKYLQQLQEDAELQSIMNMSMVEFPEQLASLPKDKNGLTILRQFIFIDEKVKEILKYSKTIIDLFKAYQYSFSKDIKFDTIIDECVNRKNEIANWLDAYCNNLTILVNQTGEYNLSNSNWYICDYIQSWINSENLAQQLKTSSDITQYANLLNQLNKFIIPLQEITIDLLTEEQISYSNPNNYPDFMQSIYDAEWVNNNSNYYSCYVYIQDDTSIDDGVGGDSWRRITQLDNKLLPTTVVQNQLAAQQEITGILVSGQAEEQTTRYKVVLVYNHQIYTSNEIVLFNEKNVTNLINQEQTQNLKIKHGDNSYEVYNIYNQYNLLNNQNEAEKIRQLELHYEGLSQGDEALSGNKIAYWYIPTYNSMLIAAEEAQYFSTEKAKPGYACYKHVLNLELENGKVVNYNNSNVFLYKIFSQYLNNCTNNTILCEVYENENMLYSTFINISFAAFGNNGSPYSVIVEPAPDQTYGCEPCEGIGFYKLRVSVFDEKGDSQNFNQLKIKMLQVGTAFEGIEETISQSFEHEYCYINIPYNGAIDKERWAVIQIDLPAFASNNTRFITLSTLYAIPSADSNYEATGTHTFIYSASGIIDMRQDNYIPWELYNQGELINIENVNYNIYQEKLDCLQWNDDQHIIIPSQLYLQHYQNQLNRLIISHNNQIRWIQPLIILQDKYGSPYLNEWPEQLQIDEDNNIILSTMMGAGMKDANNAFSGVLMGQIGTMSDEGMVLPSYINNSLGIGLYGMHEGEFSYGFNIEGNAFLGKSGNGRIWFDGNNGFIASGNWFYDKNNNSKQRDWYDSNNQTLIPGNQGMAIDLQQGHIDAYNFKLSSNEIQLNSSPKADKEECYMYIGDNEYYLKYDAAHNLSLSLQNLTIKAGIEGQDDFFYLSNEQLWQNKYRLAIGSNFWVDQSGNIDAHGGTIGNINIASNGLHSGQSSNVCTITSGNVNKIFQATMTAPSSTQIKVTNYGEEDRWYNLVFDLQNSTILQQNKTYYFSNFSSSAEYYLTNSEINGNGTYTGRQGKLRSLGGKLTLDSQYKYLIINTNDGQRGITFSTSPSTFSIGADGVVKCTGASIQGDISLIDMSATTATIDAATIDAATITGSITIQNPTQGLVITPTKIEGPNQGLIIASTGNGGIQLQASTLQWYDRTTLYTFKIENGYVKAIQE